MDHQREGFPTCVLLFGIALLVTLLGPVSSQTDDASPGLSIDCGSERNYTDGNEIFWVTDAGFISTGRNVNNLSVTSNKTITNGNQSTSLRVFDQGRGRDCYVLPVQRQFSYLVRLTFYYGEWNSPEKLTRFNVFLNGNDWLNMRFEKGNDYYETYTYEAMVNMASSTLHVCLVRGQGTPFISSLELRMLDSGMYLTVMGNNKYMGMFTRVNAGAYLTTPFLRYPDDKYDRLWYSADTFGNITPIAYTNASTSAYDPSTTATANTTLAVNPSLTPERPPRKVMEDAWTTTYDSSYLSYLAVSTGTIGPTAIYAYFQEVVYPVFGLRGMNFSVNEFLLNTLNSSSQPYEVRSCILDIKENFVNITVEGTSPNSQPLMNAFEIYFVYDWNASTTSAHEVELITGVKNLFNLEDWAGDPCVPVPYDWLSCSTFNDGQSEGTSYNNQTRTTSVIQSNVNITGMSLSEIATMETVPGEISNLSALTTLILSNTGLRSISSSSFSGLSNLTLLDVSNNRLSGSVLNFVQTINNTNLQQLYAANNSFEGDFPLDQLLAEFPILQEAIFDRNPKINGNLNLTSWYTYMVAQTMKSEKGSMKADVTGAPAANYSSTFPSVSLANNDIVNIIPSLDVLIPVIASYLSYLQTSQNMLPNNITGIILGGNPVCNKTASRDATSTSFLCRTSISDRLTIVTVQASTKNDQGPIIGGVVGGVAALFACILFAVVWKLRQQNSSLKQIQEAWAKQKVQPRLYSYSDLRRATKNFSEDHKLGAGTFGAVYKGQVVDSEDGSLELVAVKELFPSKQALPEFLNEAVLITGIKHRNLVQLKGCCIDHKDKRFLVYEYAENGNLAEALWDAGSGNNTLLGQKCRPTLDWQQRLKVCVGIARGLSYLHEELQPKIIHRDIKPANILLDKHNNAKIADFGLARSMLDDQTQADFTRIAGTHGYFSPEYVTQCHLTEKVDVFAFGVVLLEIVSGRKTVDKNLPEDQQYLQPWARDRKDNGRLLDLVDPNLMPTANDEEVLRVINLAFLCLDYYPEKRPTMSEAVTMLQGIMVVTLYRPETGKDSDNLNDGDYVTLWPTLDVLSEEYPSESVSMLDSSNISSSSNHDLELSALSRSHSSKPFSRSISSKRLPKSYSSKS